MIGWEFYFTRSESAGFSFERGKKCSFGTIIANMTLGILKNYSQKRPLKKFHFSSKIKLPPYHVSTTSENRFLSSKIFRNSHRGVRNILAKFQPWKIKLTSPTVNFLTCQICRFSI